jgi:hypothetical protein
VHPVRLMKASNFLGPPKSNALARSISLGPNVNHVSAAAMPAAASSSSSLLIRSVDIIAQ